MISDQDAAASRDALTSPRRTYAAIAAAIGWLALALQLQLFWTRLAADGISVPAIVARFFGFFTITTNTLIALAFTAFAIAPRSGWGRFFSRPSIQAGLGVSAAIVGILYSLLLRKLWNPQGLQLVADVALHDVMTILYVLFWFLFAEKGRVRWQDSLVWLAYPLAYLPYALFVGARLGKYPYPFIDADALGYPRVFLNVAALTLAFLGLSLVWLILDRSLARKLSPEPH